jgi:hypothetical protein
MFKLTLLDIEGKELSLGDWVKCMSLDKEDESRISFYLPISIKENRLVPFDTHCWNYIKKIKKEEVPAAAIPFNDPEIDGCVLSHDNDEKYLQQEAEKYCQDYKINLWYNVRHHGYKIELLNNPEKIQLQLF